MTKLIIADPITVKETQTPPTETVKKVLKKEAEQTLETVSDDKHVYWVDVKNTYPELEGKLKPLFQGKDKISVKALKDLVHGIPEDNKFWLSQTTWDSHLQKDISDQKQIVIQLNMDQALLNEINSNEAVKAFFKEFSQSMASQRLHPVHSQTIAWARVYPMKDKWVVEEIQSDLFGSNTKQTANSSIDQILSKFTTEEKADLEKFFATHFKDWDKKLMATVISMARKEGIKDIWMFDEDIKKRHLESPSKLERYYKVVPRDLGFKRDTLEVGEQRFSAWHRIAASVKQVVKEKYTVVEAGASEVANTIKRQIAAIDKMALWAWGAKNFYHGTAENGLDFLQFSFRTPKIPSGGRLKIFLDHGKDLYNLKVYRVLGKNVKVVGEMEGIFAEDLVTSIDSLIENKK